MKNRTAFLVLSLLAISSAAAGQSNISQALNDLERSTRALLAAFSMISLGVGGSLVVLGAAVHFLKVRKMENAGKWKPISMVLLLLGALGVSGATVGILLYILTPVLIRSLMAPG